MASREAWASGLWRMFWVIMDWRFFLSKSTVSLSHAVFFPFA